MIFRISIFCIFFFVNNGKIIRCVCIISMIFFWSWEDGHPNFWGFLGIITHKYPLYRAYIGISHRGTLGSGYILAYPLVPGCKELQR